MPRGRPPKSEALKRAQGLRSHKKKPPVDSKPAQVDSNPPAALEAPTRVAPPAWLSDAGRKVWRIAAPALLRQGLLTDADAIAFGRYCEWLREYEAIQARRPKRRSVVVKTKSKHTANMQRIDRTFQALLLLDKRLSEYEDRFGMNPRERLAILAKMAAGHHVPPQPPAKPPELEPGGSGRVITPLVISSPVGILNTRPH